MALSAPEVPPRADTAYGPAVRLRHGLLLLYTLLALFAVSVPALAQLTGPVFGIPSAIAWNLGWLVASFGAMGVFHLADGGEQDR